MRYFCATLCHCHFAEIVKYEDLSNADLLNWISVLLKLLTSLNSAETKPSGEQELQFLQSLLQSKEINALVNVHHKVAKIVKDDRIAPILSASMQVNLLLLIKLKFFSNFTFRLQDRLGNSWTLITTMSFFSVV